MSARGMDAQTDSDSAVRSSRGTQIDRASGRRGGGGAANAGRRRRWRRRLRHPRSPAAEHATALAGLDTVADRMTSASTRSTPAGAPAPTGLPSAGCKVLRRERSSGVRPVGELEDPRNSRVSPTTRCCGAGGIVRPTAYACARQRQGASLRSAPAVAGLSALTPAPRTPVQTGFCPTMPNSDPYMLWSTTYSESLDFRRSLTWSVCTDFSGRRRRVWLGQPHVHTGFTERLRREFPDGT